MHVSTICGGGGLNFFMFIAREREREREREGERESERTREKGNLKFTATCLD